MNRYAVLLDIVRELMPAHVVEIGTWNGKRAAEFMAITNCYYTGFDLFEEATEETDKREFNVKRAHEMVEVAQLLETVGAHKFCLVRGDTNKTLWETEVEPFDFCFIDGGHSVKTITNDFSWAREHIEPGGVIVLDDYYTPEVEGMGCNFLEDEGEVIKCRDRCTTGETISLLRVDC